MTGPSAETTDDRRRVAVMAAYDEALASGINLPATGTAPDDAALLRLLDQLRQPRSVGLIDDEEPDAPARYVLRRLHAEGGVGQVWLAHDTELGRDVALKVLRPDRSGDPALEARFLFEARVTGRLQHPGIVPVYELAPGPAAGSDEPTFYVMRLVQGRTLSDAIRAYHSRRVTGDPAHVEWTTLVNAFVSVCHTVAYAHSRGVIHRDLKPANVALGDYGEVVVLDWGFAKVVGQPDDLWPVFAAPPDNPRQTSAGQVLGTPAYMAPEQAAGRLALIDERTDVYGLGAILFELLTGQPPYPGEDAAAVIQQVLAGPPPSAREIVPSVPAALEAVCRKALAHCPADRYQSAVALARDIQHWLADEPLEAYPEPLVTRLRRWGRWHPALIAASAALAFTGLFAAGLGQVLIRQEQARAAEDRAEIARIHANSIRLAQDRQRVQMYLHRIGLAERTLSAHNPGRAIALLDECPAELRNWEWHCLNRLCHADVPPLRGHTETVHAVTFSPDGRTLYSAGFDGTVRVWDVATGRPRGLYSGHDGVVYDLACSPDGRHIASAGWDGNVLLWDTDSGRLVQTFGGHGTRAECVTYDPNGRTIYSYGNDGVIRAWDTTDGRLLHALSARWRLWCLRASPTGHLLATGDAVGAVRLIDPTTWEVVYRLEGHRHGVRAIAFSADGRLLATGDGDMGRGDAGEIKVWDLTTRRELFTLRGHTDPVLHVAFANGTRLASAGQDHTVKIWDLVSGQEALTLHAHTEMVRCVAFSRDGRRLASAGSDRLIRLWDATPWEDTRPAHERGSIAAHNGRALGVAFHPGGGQLATVGADKFIRVWAPDNLDALRAIDLPRFGNDVIRGANADYYAVAYSPDGTRLVTGNGDGTVVVLDAEGQVIRTMLGHTGGPIRGIVFRPGGRAGGRVESATASWDRTVRVWDMDSGVARLTLNGHSEPVNGITFSPDGRWLASASNDRTVRIWDADDGHELRVLDRHVGGVLGVAVSPDGALLASAGIDGTIRLFDTSTWEERSVLMGHTSEVRAVAFAPDGRRLASAGHDWTVRLWDVRDGGQVAVFRGHTDRVHGLAFSPDGSTLASAGYDGAVKLWDVAEFPD